MKLQAGAGALDLRVMHICIMPLCASVVVLTPAHMLKRRSCAVNKFSTAACDGNTAPPSGIRPGVSAAEEGLLRYSIGILPCMHHIHVGGIAGIAEYADRRLRRLLLQAQSS